MTFISESSRHTWLAAAVAAQKTRITVLLRRLTGFGARGVMNPTIFGKFLHMLDQIAVAREKEIRILNQIEAVERKHRFRRAQGQLKHEDQNPADVVGESASSDSMPACRPYGLLWFLVFWHLFMRGAINQKKQGLTVD